jgi:maleate cis-trans isomerase
MPVPEAMVRTRRIGCIVPAPNVRAEEDFVALAPPGVAVHFHRMEVDLATPLAEVLDTMVAAAPRLAQALAGAEAEVIAFACTSASFHRGAGSDRAIEAAMTAASGVPAVATSRAVVEALRAVGARRIAVATPYVDWIVAAEQAFLAAAGFDVRHIAGLGLVQPRDIHAIVPEDVARWARACDRPDADALFVSCTDYAAVPAIAQLERELGKPVVTSNQATYWACARCLGVAARSGYGRLFAAQARAA